MLSIDVTDADGSAQADNDPAVIAGDALASTGVLSRTPSSRMARSSRPIGWQHDAWMSRTPASTPAFLGRTRMD